MCRDTHSSSVQERIAAQVGRGNEPVRSQKICSAQNRVTSVESSTRTLAAVSSIVANWIAAKTAGLSYGL